MTAIDTFFLCTRERGLPILSFEAFARSQAALNPEPDYVFYDGFYRPKAQPKIITSFTPETGDVPDITADSITIKKQDSFDVGLPCSFAFAQETVVSIAKDLIELYGPSRFQHAQLGLILLRTDVATGTSQRRGTILEDWHDHLKDESGIDLTYTICDSLATEFKDVNGAPISAQPFAVTRFGAEVEHRAPANPGADLRRTWGAVIVYPEGKKQKNEPYNPGLSKHNERLSVIFSETGALVTVPFAANQHVEERHVEERHVAFG